MSRRSGERGELWAAVWLWLHGWRLVARNWRGGGGELDLVVVRGAVLAVCEVKTRRPGADLDDPVPMSQRPRLRRAAEAFLRAHPELAGLDVRLDLVTVTGTGLRRRVRHRPGGLAGDTGHPEAAVMGEQPAGGRRGDAGTRAGACLGGHGRAAAGGAPGPSPRVPPSC
jgi:putative endonuclease